MSKQIQLSIPTPCHENWENMSPVDKGKFCGSCQKQVIDFSTMSDRQVAEFFKKPSTGSVCGRFMNDQLNRDITIPRKRIPWLKYFLQIAIPAFLFSYKGTAQGKVKVKEKTETKAEDLCTRPTMGIIALPDKKPAKVVIGDTLAPNTINRVKKTQSIDPGIIGSLVLLPVQKAARDTSIKILMGKVAFPGSLTIEPINGEVIDEEGNPVPFASIYIKGTKTGTAATDNGGFELKANKGWDSLVLSVSSIGFESAEFTIYNSKNNKFHQLVMKRALREMMLGEITVNTGLTQGMIIRCYAGTSQVVDTAKTIDPVTPVNIPIKPAQTNTIYINVYPNPVLAGSLLAIEFENTKAGNYTIQLLDVAGKIQHTEALSLESGKWLQEVQVPPVPGTYFLSILNSTSNTMTTKKVIVR